MSLADGKFLPRQATDRKAPMSDTPAVGDLVRAVKGESSVVGRVSERTLHSRNGLRSHTSLVLELTGPGIGPSLTHLETRGYELTVVERYVKPLPTTPGVYLDSEGDVWRIFPGETVLRYLSPGHPAPAKLFGPFTALEEAE